ncbi:MAG: hypothetical protein ABIR67_04700, partial [Gaiellaceae bacterium]
MGERRELDRGRGGPGGAELGEVGARQATDEDRRVAAPAGEVLHEVEERWLSPLHVVEHEHDRSLARQRLQQAPYGPVELVASRARLGPTKRFEDPAADD